MRLPPNVRVQLGHSKRACIGIAVAALATGALVVLLELPMLPTLAMVAVLLGWAGNAIRVIGLRRGPRAIVELTLTGDRMIVVRLGGGRLLAGHVRDATYVGSRITTVVWRPDRRMFSRSLLVLPDMLPADDFRRLRILLRYGRVPASVGTTRPDSS